MRIKHKLHYILKYLVLALPIITIITLPFVQDTDIFTNTLDYVITDLMPITGFPSQWYFQLLDIVGVDYSMYSTVGQMMCFYPLYVFYVYLFDLILDIICFLPKFLHNLFYDLMEKGKF